MKKWYESKTVWLNVISIVLEVLNLLMDNPIIPAKYAGALTMLVNVLNIILRFITTTAIGFKSDVVINEVLELPATGVDGEWYHVAGEKGKYWYYKNGQWQFIIGGRPTDRS